ncbi:hypothetical protein H8356DRAFT_1269307 [Neocallimastix lanati (nom. inval.)]|uniref:C2H2-type domain-containing protein n=1 Tax=Neocallimastix californiae TaxID=1754190 RepID=A0A1Y2CB37_9FUNG|nr:hypothetical protein H8356DRAFT_1269307 [Neocallimastix sp. JGI-2020a]ORY44238.1 hypothetical protein LY90DRAFT_416977 [Neocallimastix californiae]|eukprot:ORY44238.1 hypothetical protein LY90DRAFT_416977 [Neocallimastix californiae]
MLPNSTTFINERLTKQNNKRNSVFYGTKPFKCVLCNTSFKRKYDLLRHKRIHTGEKPFVCEICNKRFSRSDILKRHMKKSSKCLSQRKLMNC